MFVDLDVKMKPKLENLCYTLANLSLKYYNEKFTIVSIV